MPLPDAFGWGRKIVTTPTGRVSAPPLSEPESEPFAVSLGPRSLRSVRNQVTAYSAMTTAAPPCTPVTPSPGPRRHESQPTPCAYRGTGEGRLRTPSNPRPLAPLPERLAHRRRSPRTPAAVRAWRSGAPVWSPPTSRRQTSSPPPRPSGSPTSGSGPTRPSAVSASMPPSASRSPRRSVTSPAAASTRRRRAVRLPAGTNRAAGRGLGATPSAAKGAATAALFRALLPDQGRGSLPAQSPRKRGDWGRGCHARRATGTRAFEDDDACGRTAKAAAKGGCCPFATKR